MDMNVHHLMIKAESAKTDCGKEIAAYYPMSKSAMTTEAGQEPIRVSILKKDVTCIECKKRMKKGVDKL